MGIVNVKADMNGVPEALEKLLRDDLPFATALALTRTAQAAQEKVRKTVAPGSKGIFQVRNDWTQRGIRITPATKQKLVSEVYTDTSNWSTGAPDYLGRQEDGGERVPVNGRQHIAIPEKGLWLLTPKDRPIPDWLRPRNMLKYAERNGEYTSRRGTNRKAPVPVRELYFFKVTFKSGAVGIVARHYADRRDAIYVMYILVTRAHIRKRFHLQEDVTDLVNQEFTDIFTRAAAEVMANRGDVLAFR